MINSKEAVRGRIHKALSDEHLRMATRRATDKLRHNKLRAAEELGNWEEWRQTAERIRTHVIENLDYYLKQLIENVEKRGGHVHLASSTNEAVKIVHDLIRRHDAKMVLKSKSMISEEIHLNPVLEDDGIEVIETDLAEYIIQIAKEPPSHIIVPAMHKTRQQIADLFEPIAGHKMSSDTPTLTKFAREKMREKFLTGKVGITGCNFAVASTGSISMVTNEGNGRMCSTLPELQITLMGMERIVPSFKELGVLLNLLGRSATGQRLSVYTTINTPPRSEGDVDGPKEFHLIILDHNRSKMLGDSDFKTSLRCIRCGACFNVCPVYRQVGGHSYGSVYGGPIGIVITPLLEQDWKNWGHLPNFSTLCGACSEACPVRIPLHELIVKHRYRKVTLGETSSLERRGFNAYRYYFTHPNQLEKMTRWGSRLQGFFMRNGKIVTGPPPISNWTRSRTLPAIPKKTFYAMWPSIKENLGKPNQRGDKID